VSKRQLSAAKWTAVIAASRVEPGVTILVRLVQDSGEPQAFKYAFDPLFPHCRGKQRDGFVLINREASIARPLKQSIEKRGSTGGMVTKCRYDRRSRSYRSRQLRSVRVTRCQTCGISLTSIMLSLGCGSCLRLEQAGWQLPFRLWAVTGSFSDT